ncbi:hypothetical protein TWF730_010113 [Orbilia blumenaviensis]|uniref:Cytochrome b5 heme-binding domain-containing protein n=1 Tax=Orbilia blumenaviensis TaxID=1796055 RepID=A0AAV9UTR7_9PEZI
MLIGIAALVLAVGAYIYKEGLRPHEILTRLANPFAFWGSKDPQKTIIGSSNSSGSINLEKVGGSENGTAGVGGYKAGLPSRREKVDTVVIEDDGEEEDPTTPTAPVKIELSIPDVEEPAKEVRRGKGKTRKTLVEDDDSDEDLSVPMFPALNSAQRAGKPSPLPQAPSLVVPGIMAPPPLPVPKLAAGPPSLAPPSLMAPPPIPIRKPMGSSAAASARNAQYSRPGPFASSSLSVPPSASSLAVPPSASSSLGVTGQKSSLQLPPTHSQPPPKPRQKVILTPGHSPLDWANHQRSLPFVPLRRITPSELATHGPRKNETKTYWTVLEGKVYDMTPYLPYHPGGEKELLRVAGKDGTKLFNLTHPWVNWDNMLRGCEVGILVSENEMPKKEVMLDGDADGGEDLESMD